MTIRRAMVLIGVALAVLAGWAIATLRVEEIRVVGAERISPNEIVERAGVAGDERILWMRASVVARRLNAIPAVRSASVERALPTTLVLRVDEREPVVRLTAHPGLVADVDGVVFEADPDGLPALYRYGPAEVASGAELDGAAGRVLDAFASFPASIRSRARSVVLHPNVTVVLDDGTEVRFGRAEELEAKASAAAAVLAVNEGTDLSYVDVRTPEVPTTRRRPTPSPPPEPAPTPPALDPAAPPDPPLTTPNT